MSSMMRAEGHRAQSSGMSKLTVSKVEPEKDCAFSDTSSGYLSAVDQTDSEDVGRASTVQGSHAAGPRMAVVAGPYPNLSPMIIMNNVVLKQQNAPTPAVKSWGFQPTLEMLPQPQVVFLQPVVSNGTSAKKDPAKPHSRKYLPILKSYPKIAPYPGESPSEKSVSNSSEWSSSASSHGAGRHRRRHHREKPMSRPADSTKPSSPATVSPVPVSPKHSRPPSDSASADTPAMGKPLSSAQSQVSAGAQSYTVAPLPVPEHRAVGPIPAPLSPYKWAVAGAEGSFYDEGHQDTALDGCNKRKRFCNTYNILHRSGLLGITLRTKELIRLNRCTQGQLELLREHTSLFVEAVHSGDPQVWAKLQLTMLEAGSLAAEAEQQQQAGAPLEKAVQDSHA